MTHIDQKGRIKHHTLSRRALYLAIDVLILNASFQFAFLLRFSVLLFQSPYLLEGAPTTIYNPLELYITGAWIVISVITRLYGDKFGTPAGRLRDLFKVIGFLPTAVLVFIVAQGGYNYYSRGFLIYFFLIASSALFIFRIIISSTQTLMRSRDFASRDILIIGAGRKGERF